jgi:LacI family transcriptional regulator
VADRSTIYEVAERRGVSTATVSRVMADGRGFSAATRLRVLAAAAELGWIPSGQARGLALRRARIAGLLFPDLGRPSDAGEESPLHVDQVIRGAERAATAVQRGPGRIHPFHIGVASSRSRCAGQANGP